MLKLMVISHTFQKEDYYHRWELLSQMHDDIDVTLLAPAQWNWGVEKNLTFGNAQQIQGKLIEKERFRIHLIQTSNQQLGDWTSKDMEKEILDIKPDIVYLLSVHTQLALCQLLHLRKKHHLKHMKVICFSMRGTKFSFKYRGNRGSLKKNIRALGGVMYGRAKLWYFNHNCDAVFCHYPVAASEFRREGFKKPIYMQTQVGYDPDLFHPDMEARRRIREKYNIGDAFLFGSASRFNYSKGLSEIIQALPQEGNWKYLMMGWGRDDEVEKIKKEIAERGFTDRIILTGFINNLKDMAEHWNALDCAVHAPLTVPEWEETFSLALVQAMGTGLPVIGSDSGSVPYQIGPDGIIVAEGNIEEMRENMILLMNNPRECKKYGRRMYERAISSFNIYHLDELFYLTIKDILQDVHDPKKEDMAGYMTKENKVYVPLD